MDLRIKERKKELQEEIEKAKGIIQNCVMQENSFKQLREQTERKALEISGALQILNEMYPDESPEPMTPEEVIGAQ